MAFHNFVFLTHLLALYYSPFFSILQIELDWAFKMFCMHLKVESNLRMIAWTIIQRSFSPLSAYRTFPKISSALFWNVNYIYTVCMRINGDFSLKRLFVYTDCMIYLSVRGMWRDTCRSEVLTSKEEKERERKRKQLGEAEGAKRNSLLKLLWFLLRLFLVGDNKVDGILWLLKQSSQFSLDLLSPEDSTNTNPYGCPLELLTYIYKQFYDVIYELYMNAEDIS